jgi:hypothetical protein
LQSSSDIIRAMKSKRIRGAGYVVRMEEMYISFDTLVGKRVSLRTCDEANGNYLVQYRIEWRAPVNIIMNLGIL